MHKIGLSALIVYHHGLELLMVCEKLDLYHYKNQPVVTCSLGQLMCILLFQKECLKLLQGFIYIYIYI